MRRGLRIAHGIGLALALFLASAAPGNAQTAVTLTVAADGDVAAAITAASLPTGEVGFLDLTIRDDRGRGDGWDIVLSVTSPDVDIVLVGRADVSVVAGQAVVAEGPNTDVVIADRTVGALRTTDTPPANALGAGTSVLRAAPGAGSGSYDLHLAAAAARLPGDTIVNLTVGIAP